MTFIRATATAVTLAASIALAPVNANAAIPAIYDINPTARVLNEAQRQLSMIVIWMCIRIPGCAAAAYDPDEVDIFKPSVEPELLAVNWKKLAWWILI